jgi:demethylspheroidene O-methyltransferase
MMPALDNPLGNPLPNGPPLSLGERVTDRVLAWRDRLLGSHQFQLFAAKAPVFSWIARKRSAEVFDIAAGFVYTQVLYSCVKLKVFEMLASGPLPLGEIARRTLLPLESANRLMQAAAAIRLLERRGKAEGAEQRYGLGMLGAALNGTPGVKAMMHHNQVLYRDLIDPVSLLRGEAGPTALSRYWPYAADEEARQGITPDEVVAYTDLMAESQGFVADDILSAYDISQHRCLMDVGGGDGSFLRSAAKRSADLQLMLFDLPPVAETAWHRFAAAGLERRAVVHGGDFQNDSLPPGADVISLVRVAHDHDDPVVVVLLAAAFAALPPGGTLLVAEPMSGVRGAESMADAYFGLYLLAMGTGRARTPKTLVTMLKNAGFTHAEFVPTRRPLLTSLIVAKKAPELRVSAK